MPTKAVIDFAKFDVYHPIVWLQSNGFPVGSNRVLELLGKVVTISKKVIGDSAGLYFDFLTKRIDRFRISAQVVVHSAQVIVGARIFGVETNRFLKRFYSLVLSALPVIDHSKAAGSTGVVVDSRSLLESCFCF